MTTSHAQDGVFGQRGNLVAWSRGLFEPDAVNVGEILAATEFAETRFADDIVFNVMDVSIIRLLPDVPYTPLPVALGGLRIGDSVAPQIGDKVFKVGAATGITEGTIIAVDLRISMPKPGGNPAWLKGVFEVRGEGDAVFSRRGDSGGIVFKRRDDATADVVGMIFGSAGQTTYAFPLRPVLDSFRCRLFAGARKRDRPRPAARAIPP